MFIFDYPFIILFLIFLIIFPFIGVAWTSEYEDERVWKIVCCNCNNVIIFKLSQLKPKDNYCGGYFTGYKNFLYIKCKHCNYDNTAFKLITDK